MVNFCNPGLLGDAKRFRRHYEAPILASREPFAAEEVLKRGEERSAELSAIVNQFILRRTNKLLSAHLPPKARGGRAVTHSGEAARSRCACL